jgi:hypothetical protein
MRQFLLLAPFFLLFSACRSPSNSSAACANNPKGHCGVGSYCDDDGKTSQCRPIPSDRTACGPEKWLGECRDGRTLDGGVAIGENPDGRGSGPVAVPVAPPPNLPGPPARALLPAGTRAASQRYFVIHSLAPPGRSAVAKSSSRVQIGGVVGSSRK